jgi:hypothetical protein
MTNSEESPIERWRTILARAGVALISAAFLLALIFWSAGRLDAARTLVATGCGLLVAMPLLSMAAALAEEVRRRDWAFAGAALVVVLLLALSIARRLA